MSFIIFIFLAFNQSSFALDGIRFSVGTDLFQSQYKESNIKYDEYDSFKDPLTNIRRLSLGVSIKPFKSSYLILTARTNRLINFPIERRGVFLPNNKEIIVSQKLIADSLILSHPLNKKVFIHSVLSDVTSKSNYYIDNKKIFVDNRTSLLYGFGCSVFIDKMYKHNIGFTYFPKNNKMNLSRAFGLSYNYII